MPSIRHRRAARTLLAALIAAQTGPSLAADVVAKPAVRPGLALLVPQAEVTVLPASALPAASGSPGAAGPAAATAAAGSFGAEAASAPRADAADAASVNESSARWDGAAAARLHAAIADQYEAHNRPTGFLPPRLPFSMGDYLAPWTRKSRDAQRAARDTLVRPMVEYWAAFSREKTPELPGERWNPLFYAPWRALGENARKVELVLDFLDRVESKRPQWTTPNDVVLDRPSFKLRAFHALPGVPIDGSKTPVLIIPPNSGHLSTIADYAKDRSLVQTSLEAGRPTYAIDWQSATPDNIQLLSDMFKDVVDSIGKVERKVRLVGLCQGGCPAVEVNAIHPEKVESLTVMGSPIDATRGDNAITRTAKDLPIEFFNWLVHGIGDKNVQDGENQLEGFRRLDGRDKTAEFLLDLMRHIDDPAYVARAEEFFVWWNTTNNLSLWYLQAIEDIFKKNKLYKGELELQVGSKLVRVDPSRIKNPVIMFEGTKDDVTPPATVTKDELAGVVGPAQAGEAWAFLNEAGFIADTGEAGINREKGRQAVVEPKTYKTGFDAFAAARHPFAAKAGRRTLRKLYDAVRAAKGQSFALSDIVGTPEALKYKMTINKGHIGLYNTREAQAAFREAMAWQDKLERKRRSEAHERQAAQ